jgi:hypothetical protein
VAAQKVGETSPAAVNAGVPPREKEDNKGAGWRALEPSWFEEDKEDEKMYVNLVYALMRLAKKAMETMMKRMTVTGGLETCPGLR